jgi:hypothetical protein
MIPPAALPAASAPETEPETVRLVQSELAAMVAEAAQSRQLAATAAAESAAASVEAEALREELQASRGR